MAQHPYQKLKRDRKAWTRFSLLDSASLFASDGSRPSQPPIPYICMHGRINQHEAEHRSDSLSRQHGSVLKTPPHYIMVDGSGEPRVYQ